LLNFRKAFGILICMQRGQRSRGGTRGTDAVDFADGALALENSGAASPDFT
jgi:hypothetical protein